MFKVLTIAGSDSSGGAGIQADLKSFSANGVYGMTAITAITAQNTIGVQGYVDVPLEYISMQIDSVFADIRPDAVKTGMLSNPETVALVARKLHEYKTDNLVVDPVMIAKGGSLLLQKEAVENMVGMLFPQAAIITPNIPEAEFLTGKKVVSSSDMQEICIALTNMGANCVLLKGGHMGTTEVNDLLFDGDEFHIFTSKRIETKNTHGAGCTLASAIAANLAKGYSVYEAVASAKEYIQSAIENANKLNIGSGHGPVHHFYKFY